MKQNSYIESDDEVITDAVNYTPNDKIESDEFDYTDVLSLSEKLGVKVSSGSNVRGLKGSTSFDDKKIIEMLKSKIEIIDFNAIKSCCIGGLNYERLLKVDEFENVVKSGNQKLTEQQYLQMNKLQTKLTDKVFWGFAGSKNNLTSGRFGKIAKSLNIPIEVNTKYSHEWVLSVKYL